MAMAIHRRKIWAEKMDNGREAVVKRTDKDFADIPNDKGPGNPGAFDI